MEVIVYVGIGLVLWFLGCLRFVSLNDIKYREGETLFLIFCVFLHAAVWPITLPVYSALFAVCGLVKAMKWLLSEVKK
jgi:hypothetical protein